MPDQSFTITRKNVATEKEGIQYMESLGEGFFFINKDERKRILDLLGQPKNFSRSFDMVQIPRLAGAELSRRCKSQSAGKCSAVAGELKRQFGRRDA